MLSKASRQKQSLSIPWLDEENGQQMAREPIFPE